MPPPFRIANLAFNSGEVIDTSEADIVVFVGPNNSGKSRALTEINETLSLQRGQNLLPQAAFVLSDVQVTHCGTSPKDVTRTATSS